jgi:hypothetical protein
MKGAARQWQDVESEDALFAQPLRAALLGEPALRVVDDLAKSPPVTDAELEVLERHLRDLLHQVLFDEKPKAPEFRQSRGTLRSGIDRPPS